MTVELLTEIKNSFALSMSSQSSSTVARTDTKYPLITRIADDNVSKWDNFMTVVGQTPGWLSTFDKVGDLAKSSRIEWAGKGLYILAIGRHRHVLYILNHLLKLVILGPFYSIYTVTQQQEVWATYSRLVKQAQS
jgi:hypothetical protein